MWDLSLKEYSSVSKRKTSPTHQAITDKLWPHNPWRSWALFKTGFGQHLQSFWFSSRSVRLKNCHFKWASKWYWCCSCWGGGAGSPSSLLPCHQYPVRRTAHLKVFSDNKHRQLPVRRIEKHKALLPPQILPLAQWPWTSHPTFWSSFPPDIKCRA